MGTADGGAPDVVPLHATDVLAPLIARWAAAHGWSLSDAAILTRLALAGDGDARRAFGARAIAVLDDTGDAFAFLRAALDGAQMPAGEAAPEPVRAAPVAPSTTRPRRPGAPRGVRALWRGLATLTAAFVLFVAYGAYVDNRWYKVVEIQGVSMEPTIRNGDAIVLTRPPDTIEVGMVLTLEVDGAVVTHRVVEVHDDGTFVTKGDANDRADDFSGLDVRVVGEYRARIPRLGAWLSL